MLDWLKRLLSPKPVTNLMEFACITNTGHHREHNEDNFLFFDNVMPQEHQSLEGPLLATIPANETAVTAVFDGMGGELAGEAASYVAAMRLEELSRDLDASESDLQRAFREMQDAVRDMRTNWKLSSTGTTAVVLVCRDGMAFVGNLGDSRSFLMRDGELTPLSVSHTDERLLRSLGIDRKPALTQYLGVDESDAPIEPHVTGFELMPGDRILLVSDGLTDMVPEEDIQSMSFGATSMSALVGDLCNQALANGGEDNVTIIACEVLSPQARERK